MSVPFQRLAFAESPEVRAAIARVLASGRFVLGPEVEAFERSFAAAVGVRAAVGVSSGTDALTLALAAAGVGPGDRVLTTAFSAGYTALGILRSGAEPVFAEVEPGTLCLDAEAAERVFDRARIAAVVPVHLYGHTAAGWPRLLESAAARGLPVIEDACQAHGARFRGRPLGSFGRAAAFSFYPTKNLGGLGEGGAVVTDDPELAARVRTLRQGGEDDRRRHVRRGWNARLDELQAAVLRVRLEALEPGNRARRRLAEEYRAALAGLPLEVVDPAPDTESARHLFVVRCRSRDAFRRHLADAGIATLVHFPEALPDQPAFRGLGPVGDGTGASSPPRCPEAARAAAEVVSLPFHPALTAAEIGRVAAAARSFFDAEPRTSRRPVGASVSE